MTGPLAGKTALVTGGSRGIGKAIALRLAADGAKVIVHYGANRDGAEDTVARIEAAGGSARAIGADLTDSARIDALFEALAGTQLDILVNNAGVGLAAHIAETDPAAFDTLFDTNVRGLFFVTRHAIPRLADGGRIINLSSMVSVAAYPFCVAYAMTKAAVNSFTRSIAAELGARQITVNAVAPGATDTDFIGSLKENEAAMQGLKAGTALGRLGRSEDIADVVAFLAGPEGRWITGQVIQASGGMHL